MMLNYYPDLFFRSTEPEVLLFRQKHYQVKPNNFPLGTKSESTILYVELNKLSNGAADDRVLKDYQTREVRRQSKFQISISPLVW